MHYSLADVYIPDALIKNSMYFNKLDGFTSFRATAVIRIQVNAQPFQAGRLILSAIPMPTLISPRDDYIRQHVTLMQAVNNVQLDISKQTEVSLRIPFISPFNAYDLIHGQYPWARVQLAVYGPLTEVEQSKLQVLIWGHFESVELGAPTSAVQAATMAVEQAGVVPARPDNGSVSLLRTLESGVGSVLDVLKQGSSGVLGGLDQVMSSGSNTLSGISSFLGFSKPQLQEPGCPVYVRPTSFFQNVDGQDTSHVLAMTKANNVSTKTGLGGTSMDETSFEYVKKVPQYIGSFKYNSSFNYGDKLWETLVSPSYYLPQQVRVKVNVGSTNPTSETFAAIQPTVLNYACSSFMYWTGSLVYTFKFVKTDYHSGRVEVSFHPFTSGPISRLGYVYRCVIDLREKTEASFSVPFISPQPWKVLSQDDPLKDATWDKVGPSVTGKLYVRALTPLIQATTIVSNCIECLVEVRAGDDFRVQAPVKSWFSPVTLSHENPTKHGLIRMAIEQSGPVFAVPGTQETRTSAIEGFKPLSITNNSSDVNQIDTSMDCAGEIFGSLRALTRRFAFTAVWEFKKDDNLPILDIRPATYIRPPSLRYRSRISANTTAVEFVVANGTSPLSFISSLYAFYRGGVRFKVTTNGDPILLSGRVVYSATAKGAERTRQRFLPFMSPAGYEQYQQKRFAEFQVPYYSPTMLSVHWDSDRISQFDQPSGVLQLCSTVNDMKVQDKLKFNIAIAAADDFDLFGFLGVPFVVGEDVLTGVWKDKDGKEFPRFFIELLNVDPTYPLDIYPSFGDVSSNVLVDVKIQQLQFELRSKEQRPCPPPTQSSNNGRPPPHYQRTVPRDFIL
nr:MAG: hypothetical protein 2 [Triatovirus sp.]